MFALTPPHKASTLLMPNTKSVDQALEDKKAKQKAGRKGKIGMTWDLEVKLIGGKNLMPKDTVGEGTYGTAFSHRWLFPPLPACRALSRAVLCVCVRVLSLPMNVRTAYPDRRFCAFLRVCLPLYVCTSCLASQRPSSVTRVQSRLCAVCAFVFPHHLQPAVPFSTPPLRSVWAHSSDPYVVVQLGDQRHKSSTIEKNLNPTWNEGELPLCE